MDLSERTMKKTTTTRATHRGIDIVVMSERTGRRTAYSCRNSLGTERAEEKWFSTQGEAIANERLEIDRILG